MKTGYKVKEGIKIYYEDKDLIVVEKPLGLLSVSTVYTQDSLHSLIKKWKRRVWPVHRLDRETSGVMLFSLNEESKEALKEQFILHTIEREYHGIVCGEIEKKGVWRSFLKEDKNYFVRSHPEGEEAITHYEIIGTPLKNKTSVRFLLETGKKNQIRVQASEHGVPLLGDTKYGSTPWKRLALHAHRLTFTHPRTKKRMTFLSETPFKLI